MTSLEGWLRDKVGDVWADLLHAHKSLTMWFVAAIGVLSQVLPELILFFPKMEPYMPAVTFQTWTQVLLIGAFLLRFKTKKAMRDK